MKEEEIFQQILDLALSEGGKALDKYWKDHEKDIYWSVCVGSLYVTGKSGFAKWYRKKIKTRKMDVEIDGGSYRYDGAMMWVVAVEKVLHDFGVETRNRIQLD